MTFIGIDLGTSFIKGAVLNTHTLRPEHVERLPFPAPRSGLAPGFYEFNPAEILAAAQTLLERLAPRVPICKGILWATQMHGFVLVDQQRTATSNLVTWLDGRVALAHPSGRGSYFDVLLQRLTADERRQLGGTELRPGLPIGVLFWMAENGLLAGRRLMPVALADFVAASLTGALAATDLSNAQAHGLLNLETLAWHSTVIEKLGLEQLAWPRIVPQGSVIGHLPLAGHDVPVFAPVGDFQCAIVGSLLDDDELSLNISTGSQCSRLRSTLEFGPFQTRPYFDGRYVNTVTTLPAGRALNALVKLLGELAAAQGTPLTDPWPHIVAAAEAASEPELRAKLSFYPTPVGSRGEIANIAEAELTVGHLFRAAFRNMAENYYECSGRLDPARAWRRLVFSGGLVQKIDLLRSFIADRFALPCRYCPHSEDVLLGLLVLALAFTGRESSVAAATERVRQSFARP